VTLDAMSKLRSDLQRKYATKIVRMSEMHADIRRISSGSLRLDLAMGGGHPVGRIEEVYGPESAGKTTIALLAIIEAQKAQPDKFQLFLDLETTLDKALAAAYGVDLDRVWYVQPPTGEVTFDILSECVRSGNCNLAVIDSVSALVPSAEFEADSVSKNTIGTQARLMSKSLRLLAPILSANDCTLIFINQIREKVGVLYGCVHGSTLVNFVDGRSIPIKDVVENCIDGRVWALNEQTGLLEPKSILDWHFNGYVARSSDYIYIEAPLSSDGGVLSLAVTPDHLVLTKDGWKPARSLTIGTRLMAKAVDLTITDVPITLLRYLTSAETALLGRYDLTIEDHANYVVGGSDTGVIVHNSPEVTSGGRALAFYASMRLCVRKGEPIKDGATVIGHQMNIRVTKNKTALPFKQAVVPLYYGVGLDKVAELVDTALTLGLVRRAGARIYYTDSQGVEQNLNGKAAFADYLRTNSTEYNRLVAQMEPTDFEGDINDEGDNPEALE